MKWWVRLDGCGGDVGVYICGSVSGRWLLLLLLVGRK